MKLFCILSYNVRSVPSICGCVLQREKIIENIKKLYDIQELDWRISKSEKQLSQIRVLISDKSEMDLAKENEHPLQCTIEKDRREDGES